MSEKSKMKKTQKTFEHFFISSLTQLSTCSLLSTFDFIASFPMQFDWLFPFPSLGLSCRSLLFPCPFHVLPLGQEGLLHCAFKRLKLHLSPCYRNRNFVEWLLQAGPIPHSLLLGRESKGKILNQLSPL